MENKSENRFSLREFQIVRERLIEIAKRQETISYSQLANDCDFFYSSIEERNHFHHLLGEISKFEVKNNRPMLSILVHHKGDILRNPGKGFFNLADELNQRKKGEDDLKLKNRILTECWKIWKI